MTIEGQFHTNHPIILLAASNIKFFPTGSRYFGDATETSDWDFYTEDTPETREFLKIIGFEELTFDATSTFYNDANICSVFRHPLHIDVQLTKHLKKRQIAHKLMKLYFASRVYQSLDKRERRDLWNFIYSLIPYTKV